MIYILIDKKINIIIIIYVPYIVILMHGLAAYKMNPVGVRHEEQLTDDKLQHKYNSASCKHCKATVSISLYKRYH